jgi:hypothetical protein
MEFDLRTTLAFLQVAGWRPNTIRRQYWLEAPPYGVFLLLQLLLWRAISQRCWGPEQ